MQILLGSAQIPISGEMGYGGTNYAATTIQRTQYYPSGLPWASNSGDNPWMQNKKYNGKEFVEMHGYDTYDIVWRQYYPAIGRFQTPDPEIEEAYNESPYAMCDNNMVNRTDPDGRVWWVVVPIVVGLLTEAQPVNAPTNNPNDKKAMDEAWDNYNTGAFSNLIPGGKTTTVTVKVAIKQVEKKIANKVVNEVRQEVSSRQSNVKVNPKKEAREAGKEKRNNQPGSEKRARDYGRALEKKEGKDARRQAHDAKEKGVKNRTIKELKEDYKQK